LKAVKSTAEAALKNPKRSFAALWKEKLKLSRFAGLCVTFFGFNPHLMQEVFEAEKRCNAIEDETRRIQLSAAELLRACHEEKACSTFFNAAFMQR
jgi:hypothetical protein